jgi:hypothetical protein
VKILSHGEQRVGSGEEENVSENSSMQHGIWAKSIAGKPSMTINLEGPSYFARQKLQK